MFLINPKSKQPLYEQLVEQLRRQLVLGSMEAGEALPSVRQLAMELGINPNTIQKAYRRMEEEGMIVSIPGKGSFVSDDLAQLIARQKDEQLSNARQALQACRDLGLCRSEAIALVDTVYKEGETCSQ